MDDNEEAFRLFKLAMIHPEDLKDSFRDSGALEVARRLRRSYHKSPRDVIWQYMAGIWTACLETAARHLGISTHEVDFLTKHIVIGIPTNWPPDALSRLRAAVDAVISSARSTVHFLPEPEAAILARLPHLPEAARPEVCLLPFINIPHL